MQAQLYLTLWDPYELQPARLLCLGIFPVRILEAVAISSSMGQTHISHIFWVTGGFFTAESQGSCSRSLKKWKCKLLRCFWRFVTPWTIQPMEFSRPEYWSGYPFPSPGDLPNPGIKTRSSALRVDSLQAEPQGKPKNTRVGILSLLKEILPTQELKRGLLNCRWILSYQGSPAQQRKQ